MFSVHSKELLEKICEPITNGFGINYVKYQLLEGGLLVGKADSSTYETTQIWVYDEYGKEIRKRCYKLCREKIDQEDIAEAVTDIFQMCYVWDQNRKLYSRKRYRGLWNELKAVGMRWK